MRPVSLAVAVLAAVCGCSKQSAPVPPAPPAVALPPVAPPPPVAAPPRSAPTPAAPPVAAAPAKPVRQVGVLPARTLAVPLLASLKPAERLELSADGRLLAVHGRDKKGDGMIVVLDAATGKLAGPPVVTMYPWGRLTADGKRSVHRVMDERGDSDIVVREVASDTVTARVRKWAGTAQPAADGSFVVTVRDRTKVVAVGLADGKPLFPPADAGGEVGWLSEVYADDTRVAASLKSGAVAVFDLKAGKKLSQFDSEARGDRSLRAAPDGSLLEFLGPSPNLNHQAWDPAAGKRLSPNPLPGLELAMMPGGRVASYTFEMDYGPKYAGPFRTFRMVNVVRVADSKVLAVLDLPDVQNEAEAVAASADGKRVAALMAAERQVFVWDVPATK